MISLKPVYENKIELILNVHMETMDNAYKEYNNTILDVFDHQLSVEEIEENDLSFGFVEHNLKYEYRYIQFIEDLCRANDNEPIIIEVYLNDLENLDILRILEGLDYKDKLIFLDIVRFNKSKSSIFSIENKDLLHLFIKLSTREILFSIFHFTKIQITVVGSWDLSFPMFSNNKNDFKDFLSIARKNELFFRNEETIS